MSHDLDKAEASLAAIREDRAELVSEAEVGAAFDVLSSQCR